jgi:hypothetical protein
MAFSHTVKRFYQAFSAQRTYLFRRLLQHFFLWRLNLSRPGVIELNINTMVKPNDQAPKRDSVKPTYKKVLGFQPLQMTWGRYIIDAVFRGGAKHSLNGDSAMNMIRHVVRMIRTRYSETVFQHHFGKADEDVWECFEFSYRRKSWAKSYRAIFWRHLLEEKQFLLPRSRPSIIVPTSAWAVSSISCCGRLTVN